jgi:hypothetical protein
MQRHFRVSEEGARRKAKPFSREVRTEGARPGESKRLQGMQSGLRGVQWLTKGGNQHFLT